MVRPCHCYPTHADSMYHYYSIEAKVWAQRMSCPHQACVLHRILDNKYNYWAYPKEICLAWALHISCNSNLLISYLPLLVLIFSLNAEHSFPALYIHLFRAVSLFYVNSVISSVTVNVPISIVDTTAVRHT